MQLQSVTQVLFYMMFGKLKFLKVCQWKRKTWASKYSWCFMQSLETAVRDDEKFIETLLLWKRRGQSN